MTVIVGANRVWRVEAARSPLCGLPIDDPPSESDDEGDDALRSGQSQHDGRASDATDRGHRSSAWERLMDPLAAPAPAAAGVPWMAQPVRAASSRPTTADHEREEHESCSSEVCSPLSACGSRRVSSDWDDSSKVSRGSSPS